MATKHGGSNDGAERSDADPSVSGPGATMIGSPSLVALPQAVAEQFSVRSPDGQVDGPMSTDALIGAIRAGRYSGDESVSRDDRFWIPIVAIPDFGAAFRSAEALRARHSTAAHRLYCRTIRWINLPMRSAC